MKRLSAFIIILFFVQASCTNQPSVQHKQQDTAAAKQLYTCSMHPQVVRDRPGKCPVCGMELVKKGGTGQAAGDVDLNALLKPTNGFVVSSIPVTGLSNGIENTEINALGFVDYDLRQAGTISARVSGRIEKLYIGYRFQKITAGQKIMDIYSPELVTAEQNLLFLLQSDSSNNTLIRAAKDRLLLMGMDEKQVQQVIQTGSPLNTVTVYASYSGHIHDAAGMSNSMPSTGMQAPSVTNEELAVKEGMYVQKGQPVFYIYDPGRSWALLNIYGGDRAMIKKGDEVYIGPEMSPDKNFTGAIDLLEPSLRDGSKTLTARVYFNNSGLQIPVRSRVKALIKSGGVQGNWLPETAVLSLGLRRVVFLKEGDGFKPQVIETGVDLNHKTQVLSGLSARDSVAANAQFLTDSESFIKVQ